MAVASGNPPGWFKADLGDSGPTLPSSEDIAQALDTLSVASLSFDVMTGGSATPIAVPLAISAQGIKVLMRAGEAGEDLAAAAKATKPMFKDFNQARNAALDWLGGRGFKADQATIGKLGSNAGKPIGMKTADGSIGFRVEYDARNGAHINVWAGKEKGPHFTFEGDEALINQLVKQFLK